MKEIKKQFISKKSNKYKKHFSNTKKSNFRNKKDSLPHDLIRGKADKFPLKLDIPKEKLKEYDTGAELLIPVFLIFKLFFITFIFIGKSKDNSCSKTSN
jgi:hypothetical protein